MAVFGTTNPGTDTFPATNDRGLFGLFTLSEDAIAQQMNVGFDSTSTAGSSTKALIYSEAGTLMWASAGQAVPAGGGNLSWSIPDVALPAGNYYLGSVASDSQLVWQCETGTGQRVEGVTYASPASTMGTLNATGAYPDAYVTYITSLDQKARPVSDVTDGNWTPSVGADNYAVLDEEANNGSDYAVCTNVAGGYFEVALGVLTDPGVATDHTFRYVISGNSGSMAVSLRQGTGTTIASWTHNPVPENRTLYQQTLTGEQAGAITDWSDLRLRFEAVP